VRREALALIGRDEDDLTDQEVFARQADSEYWFSKLALDTFHTLPSELGQRLLMREYVQLQAVQLISRAMESLARTFQNQKTGM
jgi:hypothetical protein